MGSRVGAGKFNQAQPSLSMEQKRNTTKETITQFFLIVFSVVLGLYLSERIEESKNKRASEELLATVKAEAVDNIALLNYWVPYHDEIQKVLDSLSKEEAFVEAFVADKFVFFEQVMHRGTFMGRQPASDAWDIAKAHPLVVNIDYDKWVILSRIYSQQKMTFEPGFEMISLFESRDVNEPSEAQKNLELLSNHMFELVAREKQLIYYYRKAVDILDLKLVEKNPEEEDL